MYNGMNGVNVADKLGLGSEVRELKFGSSFTSGGRGQQPGSFHSVRYDFKPASVDTSKMATLDVGPNGQVTISMPNIDANGTTVFKGARKPYAKECVLVIDNDTGEVVLEKMTHNIQVKRTREEGGSKKGGGSLSMPVVPPPSTEVKKAPPPSTSYKVDPKISSRDREEPPKKLMPSASSHMQHPIPSHSQSSKRGPGSSPMPPHHQQQHHQRQSPNSGPSPARSASPSTSPSVGAAHDSHRSSSSKHSQQQQPNILSLTNFEDLLSMPQMNPPAAPPKAEKPSHKEISSGGIVNAMPPKSGSGSAKIESKSNANTAATALSESSSGEDSSSSSSSEDEDEDSSDMEEVIDKLVVPPAPDSNKSPSLAVPPMPSRPRPQAVAAPSMPTDLLCEDLQLSESGSDSD